MIVILCGCSTKSIFPSCAHPLAGSWVISVQASLLGVQGQGPGIRRKLRDLYHSRSLRRLCIGRCHVWQTMPPERPNCSLGSSFEISQPCKPPNSALQTSPDSPCEPFQLQSCCDRLLLPRHGIGLHLPPLSDVSRNMAVVDLHLRHAAANLR